MTFVALALCGLLPVNPAHAAGAVVDLSGTGGTYTTTYQENGVAVLVASATPDIIATSGVNRLEIYISNAQPEDRLSYSGGLPSGILFNISPT